MLIESGLNAAVEHGYLQHSWGDHYLIDYLAVLGYLHSRGVEVFRSPNHILKKTRPNRPKNKPAR